MDGSTGVIRVGVAGWDYPDWEGTVYPKTPPRGFDRLAWVSRFVDAIEINSTFYRPAKPRTAASWVRRASGRAGFRFTAKAHRSWTHETDFPPERTVPETLEGLRPLREAGVLGAVLVQFPQRVHATASALERIERLAEVAVGWPLVVEVRHASWGTGNAIDRLARLGIGWCVVDQPSVGSSTAGRIRRVTSPVAYLRLHGRNAASWFREGAGRDARYDYRYAPDEIEELAFDARALAAEAREAYVVQNNHFRGQALADAVRMRHVLRGGRPSAPAELVETYPDLDEIAEPVRTALF